MDKIDFFKCWAPAVLDQYVNLIWVIHILKRLKWEVYLEHKDNLNFSLNFLTTQIEYSIQGLWEDKFGDKELHFELEDYDTGNVWFDVVSGNKHHTQEEYDWLEELVSGIVYEFCTTVRCIYWKSWE